MKFSWLEHNDSLLELQISIHSCKHESVQIQGTAVDPLAVALVMTLMRTREKIKNQKAESQRPLDHEGYRGRKKRIVFTKHHLDVPFTRLHFLVPMLPFEVSSSLFLNHSAHSWSNELSCFS